MGHDLQLDELDTLLRSGGVDAVLARCDQVFAAVPDNDAHGLIVTALRLSAPALEQDPAQLPAQLIARLGHCQQHSIRSLLAQADHWEGGPWLRPLMASLSKPSGPLLMSLRGHTDEITAVAITTDGRYAVSGSVPRTVKTWDLETGGELRTLRGSGRFGPGEGYGLDVDALAVNADASRVAASNGDGRIHVWDPMSGALLQAVAGCDDEDWRSAVSADARWAASAFLSSIVPMMQDRQQGTIEVWDLERGEMTQSLQSATGRVAALVIVPRGKYLIASAGGLRVWDLTQSTARTIDGPTSTNHALAVTDDGRTAVTGHHDGTLTVWDLETGETTTLAGHDEAVTAVAVTDDGRWAASGSDDSTVRLWDLRGMAEARKLSGHVGAVRSVDISADGERAVSGGADRVLRVWDLTVSPGTSGTTHRLAVRAVSVSPDGTRAFAASEDGTTEVWDLGGEGGGETRVEQPVPVEVPPDIVETIETLERESRPGSTHTIQAIAVTPDHRRAVSASHRWTVLSGHHRWAADTTTVGVWDLVPEPVQRVLVERTQNIVGPQSTSQFRDVAITPDGRRAVSAGDDQTVTLWDVDTATAIASFTADSPLDTCAIADDGRTIAAGGETGDVHVLRLIAWK